MERMGMARGMLATFLMLGGAIPAAADSMDAGKAFTKATRGIINIATGWVELPKRVQETAVESGAATGFTWGLLRGLGYGFIRTAAGCYELFTFPFPAPSGYEPVMQPEYVFTAEPAASDTRQDWH